MHWTALLAYRRFPANARVADDLPCVGCGYNLRTIRAGEVCPECARPVGDSLFVLSKPEIVGRCLKAIGLTFLGVLAIALPCLNPTAAWTGIVGMGILAIAAVVRTIEAVELHKRGEVRSLPVIGQRLRVLIFIGIGDSILSIALCALLWYQAKVGVLVGLMQSAFDAVSLAWFGVYLLASFAAGWLGSAVAVMLGYVLSRWEFILHRIALGLTLLGTVAVMLARSASGVDNTSVLVITALAGVAMFVAMILLTLGLFHLGSGAEHEHDAWEDVLEDDTA